MKVMQKFLLNIVMVVLSVQACQAVHLFGSGSKGKPPTFQFNRLSKQLSTISVEPICGKREIVISQEGNSITKQSTSASVISFDSANAVEAVEQEKDMAIQQIIVPTSSVYSYSSVALFPQQQLPSHKFVEEVTFSLQKIQDQQAVPFGPELPQPYYSVAMVKGCNDTFFKKWFEGHKEWYKKLFKCKKCLLANQEINEAELLSDHEQWKEFKKMSEADKDIVMQVVLTNFIKRNHPCCNLARALCLGGNPNTFLGNKSALYLVATLMPAHPTLFHLLLEKGANPNMLSNDQHPLKFRFPGWKKKAYETMLKNKGADESLAVSAFE